MTKGIFDGFISKNGQKYSPDKIPEYIIQEISKTFINSDKLKNPDKCQCNYNTMVKSDPK